MGIDTPLFLFSLFDNGFLLFLTVYVIITLSDLECDYLNAQSCCSKLNKWVIPELVSLCAITVFLLFSGHWILFLLNLPLSLLISYRVITIPVGNFGIYDPTEIHNRGNLKQHLKEAMVRLGYYLVLFFVYLYCLILSLLTKSQIVESNERSVEF
ncbi:CNIH4 (predicted) [Pycnogonum litorale]